MATYAEMEAVFELGAEAVAINAKLASVARAEKIAFIFAFFGIATYLLLSYWDSKIQGKTSGFDPQYIYGAILAYCTGMLFFAGVPIPEGTSWLIYALKAYTFGLTIEITGTTLITTKEKYKNKKEIKKIDKKGVHTE